MKVSDYIIRFLADLNIEKAFYIAGGGVIHLNDFLGRNPDVEGVYMIHEQGTTIAAEFYAKYAIQLKEPEDIRYELEKAAAIAVNGRSEPVWLDIPLDIQIIQIESERLKGYDETLPDYAAHQEDVRMSTHS